VWDTNGEEKFASLTKAYYKGAIGCLLVYDISDRVPFLFRPPLLLFRILGSKT